LTTGRAENQAGDEGNDQYEVCPIKNEDKQPKRTESEKQTHAMRSQSPRAAAAAAEMRQNKIIGIGFTATE
jgi:hypothetical protein